MPNFNVKMPDELYARVRLAAACGGSSLPRGALLRFIHRALRQAVENPEPGYGLPKLKMCAKCVKVNREVLARPKEKIPTMNCWQTRPIVISEPEKRPMGTAGVFSHLLNEPAALGAIEVKRPVLAEVAPQLFVCSDMELASAGEVGSAFLAAAKEPWHREMVGYKTKSAPEGPERLVARRGNRMALNLIDVRDLGPGEHCYIPTDIVTKALEFIEERLVAGDGVVIHDPQGTSSAPGIALIYLWSQGKLEGDPIESFTKLYPTFAPHAGMKEYIRLRLEAQHEVHPLAVSA